MRTTMRVVRVPWLYEALVGIVLQQRVADVDAARSHQWLVRAFGEQAIDDERVPLARDVARARSVS